MGLASILTALYIPNMGEDSERNRMSRRLTRVAQVGVNMGAAAASFGALKLFGSQEGERATAIALRQALGKTRGPLMKVAQILATIPDFLPPDYAQELAALQANAPSMGWSFVKRRMRGELGANWESQFAQFETEAAHAASLGQVHRATLHDGTQVACKLQYPEMSSAVESDIGQLKSLLGLFKTFERTIDPTEAVNEVTDRLREELDYGRERQHMRLYGNLLANQPDIECPRPIDALSTGRLLTMTWLSGAPLLSFKSAPQQERDRIATLLFNAWWIPMMQTGVIHGDPHLGNYSLTPDAARLNLLDFGCIRIFPAQFVSGVVQLYRSLEREDFAGTLEAYEIWGFKGLTRPLAEALNVWARFIYAPLLDNRSRTVADGIAPGEYGRSQAFEVRNLLKQYGPVKLPREFVFMDRAAIGLGAAFLHLGAKLNFYQLFQNSIADYDEAALAKRQKKALGAVGLG
ncbi:ABC1 kinase family protein [Candidatus Phycosocius spiralis]|uniref:ABC transporter ATP-binding protein n=1 Tax=Candidatus Phycosocius spiralis TaxID=2815099 RepID=A0ABQ4PVQ0_9PROT|nr:AarF/UbiB family protein [Candidatus Phycosocius spiralis]GIU67112.1 ABC transporter ATP-binding protein [Candidatus Phycosocius spiralis]